MIQRIKALYTKYMRDHGYQWCPRCGEWKIKSQFPRCEWCMGCEREQRERAVNALGWLFMYSVSPNDRMFDMIDDDRLHHDFKYAIDETLKLPQGADFRTQICAALDVLYNKLGIDSDKVLW